MLKANLKKLRIYNNYTQEEIAEKLNVSRQSVAKWESGESIPDIYKCTQLSKLYDTSLDDLVNCIMNGEKGVIAPKDKFVFGKVKVDQNGKIYGFQVLGLT